MLCLLSVIIQWGSFTGQDTGAPSQCALHLPAITPSPSSSSVFLLDPHRGQSDFHGGIKHQRQSFVLHCNPISARTQRPLVILSCTSPKLMHHATLQAGHTSLSGWHNYPGHVTVTGSAIRVRRKGQVLFSHLAAQPHSHYRNRISQEHLVADETPATAGHLFKESSLFNSFSCLDL